MKRRFVVVLTLIFFMVVGFAAVNIVLDIKGSINLSYNEDDFRLEITELLINGEDKEVQISKDKQSFTFTGTGNDSVEYTVTNYSYQYDTEVKLICDNNCNVEQVGKLEAQSKETNNLTTTATTEVTCRLNIEHIERINIAEEMCPYDIGETWDFDYTGEEQEFKVLCNGIYKLEVWGSQGGTSKSRYGVTYSGGCGAYALGKIDLTKETILYVQVGGNENKFNGGKGNGSYSGNSNGGDSTHILLDNKPLKDLENNKDKILIVASGGGGGYGYRTTSTTDFSGAGGHAGGIAGTNGYKSGACYWIATGGTQTSGGNVVYCSGINSSFDGGIQASNYGSFGLAGTSPGSSGAGGGGGYYGGGFSHYAGGAGGSSYIGNSKLRDKAMYCYNCVTSTDESTKTISTTNVSFSPISNYAKQGNGYAKITYLGN